MFTMESNKFEDIRPYTDEEMSAVLSEISLAVCKAYKEIPGLPEGNYDKESEFRRLVKR